MHLLISSRIFSIPPSPAPVKRIVRTSWSFSFLNYFDIDLGTSDAFYHRLVADVRVRLSLKSQV